MAAVTSASPLFEAAAAACAPASVALLPAARRLMSHGRHCDAIHLTRLLWQEDPVRHWSIHVECLMLLGDFDSALHVLTSLLEAAATSHTASTGSVDAAATIQLHVARMRCCFELGDSKGCCASAEVVSSAATAALSSMPPHTTTLRQSHPSPSAPVADDSAATSQRVQALCYLAKCAEVGSDPQKAVKFYRAALDADPWCTSALFALIDHHLLQPQELFALIESLDFPPDSECLRLHFLSLVGVVAPSLAWHAVGNWLAATTRSGGGCEYRDDGVAADDDDEHLYTGSSTADDPSPSGMRDECSSGFVRVGTPCRNTAVLTHAAALLQSRNRLQEAARLITEVRRLCPLDKDALCVQLSILIDMKATSVLFDVAHDIAKHRGRAALAVYAIGSYYFALANYERAGRYFSRATELDPMFVEAWVAFGHCYAKLEEGEQALAVYRRALHTFPGLYLCAAYVGMQYSRIHSWKLAMCFLEDAQRSSPNDPLVLNEIAVLCVRNHQLPHALAFLEKAVEQLQTEQQLAMVKHHNPAKSGGSVAVEFSEYRDCILFNLATVYRKLRRYKESIYYYGEYVKVRPHAANGHTALGFAHHLLGNVKAAIQHYHVSMSLKPDSFCRDMLDRALASEFGRGVGGATWGAPAATTDSSVGGSRGVSGGLPTTSAATSMGNVALSTTTSVAPQQPQHRTQEQQQPSFLASLSPPAGYYVDPSDVSFQPHARHHTRGGGTYDVAPRSESLASGVHGDGTASSSRSPHPSSVGRSLHF